MVAMALTSKESLKIFPLLCFSIVSFCSASQKIKGVASQHDYAFCQDNFKLSSKFPLPPPNKYLPWVWDAVLLSKHVEITTISRNACKFNQQQWQELLELYPNYHSELANGSFENILVPVEKDFDYVHKNDFQADRGAAILDSRFQCVYIDEYGLEIFDTISESVKGSHHSDLSSIQIHCPLPPPKYANDWTMIRLDRYRFLRENVVDVLSTEAFPVCGQSSLKTSVDDAEADAPSPEEIPLVVTPRYDLTICTATSRSTPLRNLLEWIEYHRLLGVDHLYIYDTSTPTSPSSSSSQSLQSLLSEYIQEGVISVIRWPYCNCVNGMASGRWIGYHTYESVDGTPPSAVPKHLRPIHSSFKSKFQFFFPPRAISHTAALASCYARYRHETRWMAHIDDDEYLALESSRLRSFNYSLPALLFSYLSEKPFLSALAFRPTFVFPCSSSSLSPSDSRLLSWGYHGRTGSEYEVKLILRTSAVRMFFVHYLTEIEPLILNELNSSEQSAAALSYDPDPTTISPSLGTLLHYKDDSLTIYGRILGKNFDEFNENRCHQNGVLGYQDIRRFQDQVFLKRVQEVVERRVKI